MGIIKIMRYFSSYPKKLVLTAILSASITVSIFSLSKHLNSRNVNIDKQEQYKSIVYIENQTNNKKIDKELNILKNSLKNYLSPEYYVQNVFKNNSNITGFSKPDLNIQNLTFLSYLDFSNDESISKSMIYVNQIKQVCKDLSENCHYLIVLNAISIKEKVNFDCEYYLNNENIKTLFSNNDNLIVSNFNIEQNTNYQYSSAFLRTIFNVLSDRNRYVDLASFFYQVQDKSYDSEVSDTSNIFLTMKTIENKYYTRSIQQINKLRIGKIETFTAKLNNITTKNKIDYYKLLSSLKEIGTSDCKINYQKDKYYSDILEFSIEEFIDYLDNEKKLRDKNNISSKFQIFPINKECSYNITKDKIEKYAANIVFTEDELSLN